MIYDSLNKKNLFIRVDSGIEIGIGHVMRCFALAEVIKDMDFQVRFISKELKGNICDFIVENGYAVYRIPDNDKNKKQNQFLKNNSEKNIENDAFQTMEIITKNNNKPAWLLVDHYDLDIHWESIIRKHVEKIIVVDDLANRKHDCDLLLDQNLYDQIDSRYTSLVPKNCKKLLGPKYALLRPEFYELRKTLIKPRKSLRNILISFGGSDPSNETTKALQAIKILNMKDLNVDVVIWNINPHKEKIKQICTTMPNTKFYSNVDNIGELMSKADLAIGAGGTTTWERCCLGLPSIVSTVSRNQNELTKTIAKKNCVVNLGNCEGLTPVDYSNAIKNMNDKIICNMSSDCMKIVDGNGCYRVAEIIYSL
jgi:UDP-2,4-diacetamido-2,4,6-trideoxy-beta-L-altropyranose hydrolase